MHNHYHLLLETPEGNLSKGIRQLNSIYTQHIKKILGARKTITLYYLAE